jgi:hypothetical protein
MNHTKKYTRIQPKYEKYQTYLMELSDVLAVRNDNKQSIKKGTIRKYDCIQRFRVTELLNLLFKEIENNTKEIGNSILLDIILIWVNTRAIRTTYGKGIRLQSYWLFTELYKHYPYIMYWYLYEIPKIGSFVDLNNLYEMIHLEKNTNLLSYKIKEDIAKVYAMALTDDIMFVKEHPNKSLLIKKTVSYAAKWVPKEGRSLDKVTKMTSHIVKYLYPNLCKYNKRKAMKQFRYEVGLINKYVGTTEVLMASKNFSKINFTEVPLTCLTKHKKAWKGEDDNGLFKYDGNIDRLLCRHNYENYITKPIINTKERRLITDDRWNKLREMLDSDDYDHVRNIAKLIVPWKLEPCTLDELNKLPRIYTAVIVSDNEYFFNIRNNKIDRATVSNNTPYIQLPPPAPVISNIEYRMNIRTDTSDSIPELTPCYSVPILEVPFQNVSSKSDYVYSKSSVKSTPNDSWIEPWGEYKDFYNPNNGKVSCTRSDDKSVDINTFEIPVTRKEIDTPDSMPELISWSPIPELDQFIPINSNTSNTIEPNTSGTGETVNFTGGTNDGINITNSDFAIPIREEADTPDSMPELISCSPIPVYDLSKENSSDKSDIHDGYTYESNIDVEKINVVEKHSNNDVKDWVKVWKPMKQPTKKEKDVEKLEKIIVGEIGYGSIIQRIQYLEMTFFGYNHTTLTIDEAIKNLEIQLF